MKKVLLIATGLILFVSCRQEDSLSNEDIANLNVIQNKRVTRIAENKTSHKADTVKTTMYIVSMEAATDLDHEPPKIPPKH